MTRKKDLAIEKQGQNHDGKKEQNKTEMKSRT